jgi:hypothetical protein
MTSKEITGVGTQDDSGHEWMREIAYQLALLNEKLERGFFTDSNCDNDQEYRTSLR